jgi:hypothetical protein
LPGEALSGEGASPSTHTLQAVTGKVKAGWKHAMRDSSPTT